MKIRLVCKEGWKYVGWQRVFAYHYITGRNVSLEVSHKINLYAGKEDERLLPCLDALAGNCFFVLSGESFTLEDLADSISSTLNCEVICED